LPCPFGQVLPVIPEDGDPDLVGEEALAGPPDEARVVPLRKPQPGVRDESEDYDDRSQQRQETPDERGAEPGERPGEMEEAADLDGCGFLGKIRHITYPTIKGLIIIQFIAAFIVASQSTGFILVMTFGGPNEATKVAGLYIFEKAYVMLRFGTAVTMAWMLGIVMLGFTTVQLSRLSRMEFRAAGQVGGARP